MTPCPRCLRGSLFYDAIEREPYCGMCGYRPLPVAKYQYELALTERRKVTA